MKKYIKFWIGGFIATFLMPFEKWENIKDENVKKQLIDMDQKLLRVYAFICFAITCRYILDGLRTDISFIIGLLHIAVINAFASCYRYWKLLRKEPSSYEIYRFCWIFAFMLLCLLFVRILDLCVRNA